ncbi:PREDICTED: zinc finger protein 569-like [Ceratosolen solmsi marchali]|uniref:Zinc finger protein 569-like n=1 Tax=Ceratosolen solmsi marchali TaxID=326594 RepID=A0AAJ6YQN6_9HYME|nr:PREDICTED: zinc finger protein 569-like [Ceratosolen solmsi marchali]
METNENERYVSFSLNSVHEGVQDNISHEEICEPINDCVLQDSINEVSIDDINHDITETEVAVEILTENSGDEEENSVVYPIYIKKESSQLFTTGDESMAVEALRQLGGMYPCFENKKVTCPHCTNIFNETEILKHQSICPFDKHICNICGEKFERKIDLNNHLVCHQVDRPHACRTCGNLFRSKPNLQTHMVEVHQVSRPHKCTVCGADFQRPSSLSNHMKIHSYVAGRALMQGNNIINCQTLKNISNSQQSSILTSVQTIQNFDIPQVQWTIQTYDQSNVDGLTSHSDKIDTLQEFTVLPNGEVAQLEYNSQNTINDQICQEYNLTLNSFNNSDTLSKVEAINLNNQAKRTYIEVDVQENRGYICNQCGVTFARASSLFLHEKTHTKSDWATPVECEYCDKQFQDSNFLITHQASCTKKLLQNNTESTTTNAKWGKHACSECGKKFTTKQKMFRHQWIHRKKTHSCEICGSQFEKQSELDEHRLSAHPGDSPFTCNECGKSFVSRQGLWEHGRTHAGSPAYFHCDTCSKTFSSRQGYLIHHRTHTGERPYGCKFCWKAFRDGGTLRKHERIHTGERPHVCPLCTRAFNQKVVLREHVRWVHAAGKNETEISGPPFSCPLCATLTQDRDELCAHIVKHSDQMIAEAKAKSNNVIIKAKPLKKKGKVLDKPKAYNLKARSQMISDIDPNKTLFNITEQVKNSSEIQNTYLILKNDYNNVSQIDRPNKSVDVISIDKSNINDKKNQERTVDIINKEANINTMHIIPFTSDETIHLIATHKQTSTLHFISKQNENLPVLAIPNSQNNESFSGQISEINDPESLMKLVTNNCPIHDDAFEETDNSKTMIIKSASIQSPNIRYKQIVNKENNHTESEELICGICGNDFDNKNVLMDHVKFHI